jgi:hypothetical protein
MRTSPPPLYIYGILRPTESLLSRSHSPILQHRDCETVWQRVWAWICGRQS